MFLEGTLEDAEKILATEASANEHIAHLKTLLVSVDTPEGRLAIADYGVSQISENENEKLASYFFVVSSLKTLSREARDFFTDTMLYCEDDIGPLKSAGAVRNMYEKEIRPVL